MTDRKIQNPDGVEGGEAASISDTDAFELDTGATSKFVLWSLIKSTLKTYFDTLYATITGTQTLTNKRITKRKVPVTQSATPSINTDNGDIFVITGLAQNITSLTSGLSGTPNDGDMFQLWVTDDGTSRTITPGASFAGTYKNSITGLATTPGKKEILLWQRDTTLGKWELMGRDHSQ